MNYCAFLRGVNVKGTNMKMSEVCEVFVKSGMKNVTSVLASGNILFSSEKPATELKPLLEKAMSQYFDYEAFLFIKNEDEIKNLLEKNPFEVQSDFHIYGFVGINGIETTLQEEFGKTKKSLEEKSKIIDGNFYWKIAKGNTLDSTFGKILGKKSLKDSFTSRNINTFEKILKKF